MPAAAAETAPSAPAPNSIIGSYGPWAAGLLDNPPQLSFRRQERKDVEAWRSRAKSKAAELIASPKPDPQPKPVVTDRYTFDGLEIEELSWQLSYGRPTRAVVLKPQGATGPLPAVLGLHDHGGNKYFGAQDHTNRRVDAPDDGRPPGELLRGTQLGK